MPSQRRRRGGSDIVLAACAWLGFGFVGALGFSSRHLLGPAEATFWSLLRYWLLMTLAIVVWRVCERLAQTQASRARMLAAHVLMGVVVVAVWQSVFYALLARRLGDLAAREIGSTAAWIFVEGIPFYILVAVCVVAAQASRRLDVQHEREAELLLLAREAELRALKAQLRPHFLFNALNSIYSLIESQPHEARRMVELLSDLMRRTLDATSDDFVPLAWELDSLRTYLLIEQARLGPRLSVTIGADGCELQELLVPPLILQPIVENAVKHGIAPHPGPGAVEVRVERRERRIEIRVRDSGPGIRGEPRGEGQGLSITRRRLESAYGCGAFSLEVDNLVDRGFEVRLRLPEMPVG
jgi:signal transduction histidine kinase